MKTKFKLSSEFISSTMKKKQNSINSKRKRKKNHDLISFDQLFDCNGNIFRTIR